MQNDDFAHEIVHGKMASSEVKSVLFGMKMAYSLQNYGLFNLQNHRLSDNAAQLITAEHHAQPAPAPQKQ